MSRKRWRKKRWIQEKAFREEKPIVMDGISPEVYGKNGTAIRVSAVKEEVVITIRKGNFSSFSARFSPKQASELGWLLTKESILAFSRERDTHVEGK